MASEIIRALVQSADPATGAITVTLPAFSGGGRYALSFLGRAPSNGGVWAVPDPGSSIPVMWADERSRELVWTGGAAGQADEVWIGPTAPLNPDVELWVDEDAVPPPLVGLPVGGTTDQALIKTSSADYDVNWGGPYLPTAGGTETGMVTFTGTNDEKMRLRSGTSQGLISFYNAAGTTRYGYLGGSSANLVLSSDSPSEVSLVSGGSGYVNIRSPLRCNVSTNDEKIRLQGSTNPYISWFDAPGTTRYGYLQAQPSELVLAQEVGTWLSINSVGGVRLSVSSQILLNVGGVTSMGFNGGMAWVPGGQAIRFNGAADSNHSVYYNNTFSVGGYTMDGPVLQGWANVGIRTGSTGQLFILHNTGFAFSTNGWLTYSSRAVKRDIEALDPEQCLAEVAGWEPVTYRLITDHDDGALHDGFVAEDMAEVTPTLTPPSDEGAASAVNYAAAVVRLTGAVQALLARIEGLEGSAA